MCIFCLFVRGPSLAEYLICEHWATARTKKKTPANKSDQPKIHCKHRIKIKREGGMKKDDDERRRWNDRTVA